MTEVAKCSEGMAASGLPPRTVQTLPAGAPELLSVLDHHPAQLGRAAVRQHQTLARGVPGRRGRQLPVADQPEVEHRVQAGGSPG